MKQGNMNLKAMMQILCMILFLPLMISCSMRESGRTNTEEAFKNPPDSAKPQTWYHWMNGHVSRTGITKDLEAFKKVGLGGFHVFDINWQLPHGGVVYNSDEFHECLTHTASEADRLGLEMGMENASGWSCTGGPWVTPEYSMKMVVWTETELRAGDSACLARPEAVEDFYRDIAVLAFPTPQKPDYRLENWFGKSLNDKKAKEVLSAKHLGNDLFVPELREAPAEAVIFQEDILVLSDRMDEEGKLDWSPESGTWTLVRFGYTSTGRKNGPASDGAQGLEIDKLSREAAALHWRALLDRVADMAKESTSFSSIAIDSWEVHNQNWTDGFERIFEERCAYDLIPRLLCYTGRVIENTDYTERVLWDLRSTIADLTYENYFLYFYEKCHASGLTLTGETYGWGPFDASRVAKMVDWPMTEFWYSPDPKNRSKNWNWVTQVMSSAARLSGKKVVGAEAYTRMRGDWTAHPYLMKIQGNRAFCEGVNRFVFHSSAHQPFGEHVKPGMTMGMFGIQNHRNNTWFFESAAWIEYITRCQYILQTGDYVCDLLALYGEERAFSPFLGKEEPDMMWLPGNRFDLAEIGTLDALSLDREGHFRVSHQGELLPNTYKILMLKRAALMRVETARKLGELAEQGGVIFASRPIRTPGFHGAEQNDRELQKLIEKYWDSGLIRDPEEMDKALESIGPDCELPEGMEYAHHQMEDGDYYFLSNQSYDQRSETVIFRLKGRLPELWNPETGESSPALNWRIREDGRTEVDLKMDPAQSLFVVFRQPTRKKEMSAPERDYREIARIKGEWTVSFDPAFGPEGEQVFTELLAWNEHPDDAIKYFSGTASYRKSIELPQEPEALYLELGSVDVLARVLLNGEDLGVLWKPPYRVDISKAAHKGTNELEIRVTNLWVNKLIGDARYPHSGQQLEADKRSFWNEGTYTRFPEWVLSDQPVPEGHRTTFATWDHYEEGGELLPSGLTGPVRLLTSY